MTTTTIDRLSYSTVSSFAQCGEKVRLEKIVRVPRIPSWASIGGSAVHGLTEHLDRRDFGIEDGEPDTFGETLDKLIAETEDHSDIPRSEWHAAGRASTKWPEKENEKFWRANGPLWVETWRTFIRNSPWQIWLSPDGEPAIEVEIDDVIGGVENKGYVDRVLEHTSEGWLMVADLKSGARIPTSATQLRTYGHGMVTKWGVRPSHGAYFMNRTGVLTTPVKLDERGDAELDYLWSMTKLAIDSGIFLPYGNNMCSSCGVRTYCREWGGERAAEALPVDLVLGSEKGTK